MANIFLLGVTSASLSFLAVVGLGSITFTESHAQGVETTASVASSVAPKTAPKMDHTLRGFAVERLQEKLGTSLRDSVSADDNVLPLAKRQVTATPEIKPLAPEPEQPERLPRII